MEIDFSSKRWISFLGLLLIISQLQGCASQAKLAQAENYLVMEAPKKALASIESLKTSSFDRLLYWLNAGVIYRYDKNYQSSIESFAQAKAIILGSEATSITGTLSSLTLSENTKAYQATPIDTLLIFVYQMLNFLEIHDFESARVEAMQLDAYLKRLGTHQYFGVEGFARYLSGVVFQGLDEIDNAYIAFKQSLKAFEIEGITIPNDLAHQLVCLAKTLSIDEEFKTFKERFQGADSARLCATQESLLVYHVGFVPRLVPNSITALHPDEGYILHISVPKLLDRSVPAIDSVLKVNDDAYAIQLGFDLSMAIERQLDDQLPSMRAKAISRLIASQVVVNKTEEQSEILAHVFNLAASVLQTADTRQWSLLPAEFYLVRVPWHQESIHVSDELLQPPGNDRLSVQSIYWHG
ncbi:MAG: hypothetical protein AAGB12_01420 [Pseudomonadota bacterium]